MQFKRAAIFFLLITIFSFERTRAQSTDAILNYIAKYKDLAMAEMQRTGIPAAITLAQGIHETEAGTSELVRKSNNHFGIKCKDNWRGQSVSHDDDARGECFRKYEAPEESYKDHSDFLRTRPNYASLFRIDPTDYEGWAYGLKKAGYATNPKYAQVLIKLIRDYHLEDYTLMAMGKMSRDDGFATADKIEERDPETSVSKGQIVKQKKSDITTVVSKKADEETNTMQRAGDFEPNYPSGEFKINETRVLYVKKGTSYLTIAQQYEIPLAKLYEFNDIQQQEITDHDQLVFIQRKRKTGDHEFHVVQPWERLDDIAQSEAIRLESLLEYNNLGAAMQPAVGETLSLRSKSGSTPKLVGKNSMENDKDSRPGQVTMSSLQSEKKEGREKNSVIFHTVKPKETVYSIAKKYNVTADKVISWNQLQEVDLRIGQSLKIYR